MAGLNIAVSVKLEPDFSAGSISYNPDGTLTNVLGGLFIKPFAFVNMFGDNELEVAAEPLTTLAVTLVFVAMESICLSKYHLDFVLFASSKLDAINSVLTTITGLETRCTQCILIKASQW